MTIQITSARALTGAGQVAATIDRVGVGGGTQVVTVDGSPEERVHPSGEVYHVRLITPGLMIPDELREAADYAAAVTLAEEYASRLDENADKIADLAAGLKV